MKAGYEPLSHGQCGSGSLRHRLQTQLLEAEGLLRLLRCPVAALSQGGAVNLLGEQHVCRSWQWHGASCVGSLRCVNHCRAHGAIQHQLTSSANYSMQFHLSLFDAASRMVGQSVHIHPNSAKEIQQYKRHWSANDYLMNIATYVHISLFYYQQP